MSRDVLQEMGCTRCASSTLRHPMRLLTYTSLGQIRGELMRASRILLSRPDRAILALSQLCEERKEEELLQASPARPAFAPPTIGPPSSTDALYSRQQVNAATGGSTAR